MIGEAKQQLLEKGWLDPFVRGMFMGRDGKCSKFRLSWRPDDDSAEMLRQAEQLIISTDALAAGFCSENLLMVAGGAQDSSFTCHAASTGGIGMTATMRFRRADGTIQSIQTEYTIVYDQQISVFG